MDILRMTTVFALLRHPDLAVAEEAVQELIRRGVVADEAWLNFYEARHMV